MARVYISIGSNIQREDNIRAAVQALRRHFEPLTLSSVYQNRPIGFEGNDFFNLVAGFDTDLDPVAVTEILHDIEQQRGRQRGGSRFSSRSIDLDLLLYNSLISDQATLTLPRREVEEYACVLRPLAEIAPDTRHPRRDLTFAVLWEHFDQTKQPLKPVRLDLSA